MWQGDYGGVPPNTTHTFQILEPETEMVGIIAPGGFEVLFYALANANYSSPTLSPYNPVSSNASSSPPPSVIAELTSFDVYAEFDFVPRSDLALNGAAPAGSTWHDGNNSIAPDSATPAFIAKNFGPKYLSSAIKGSYQIIQPFVTPGVSDHAFTLSTITMSPILKNAAKPVTINTHNAFQVLEGKLNVLLQGEILELVSGDTVFITAGTQFTYWNEVAFTKVLYIAGEGKALDTQLIAGGVPWNAAVWPVN